MTQKWKLKEKSADAREMPENGKNRKNKRFWRTQSGQGREYGRKRWEIMEILNFLFKYKVVFFSKPLDY